MSEDLSNVFNDNPMDDFFGNFGRNLFDSVAGSNQMRTDVVENPKDYRVTAELPGFKKNAIHMDYRDNTLRIHAAHKVNHETKNDQGRVLRKERSSSDVSRAFYLPNVNFKKITATYDGGLLKVSLPKVTKASDNSHRIDIK